MSQLEAVSSGHASTSAVPAESNYDAAAAGKASSIPVRLVSRSAQHSIPSSKFMIPSDWRRFQLSELINKVLGNAEAVPFDFIVNEELLRSSLGEWTAAKGLTEETVLEVEYVESILPPKYLSSFEQEDWISDIDISQSGYFLTSSYDSNVRLFTSAATGPQATLSGHTLPVLSACWLPTSSSSSASSSSLSSRQVASGGMDRVVRVWDVPLNDPSQARATHALSLHTSPVSSVRAGKSTGGDKRALLSAGWDGLVGFWELDLSATGPTEDAEEAPRSKKRRVGAGASTSGDKVIKVHPTLVLTGHSGQVSRAIMDSSSSSTTSTNSRAFSFGADDHCVKAWDLDMAGQEVSSKRGGERALLDGAQLATADGQVLVSGNSDKTIAVWDLREENTIVSLSLLGHTSSVAAVATHPDNPNLLASASYDGTSRIWDVRSPRQALFNLPRQNQAKGKLLCVQWNGALVAAGGEDKKVELFHSKGI